MSLCLAIIKKFKLIACMDKDAGNKHPSTILAFKLVQAFWRAIWHCVLKKTPKP